MTPADVINTNRLFFTQIIRDTITRLTEQNTIKTWTRATCFVVKPPETETSVRFYNLKSLLIQVSDAEIDRILDVWARGFDDRVERDTEMRSGISVIGTDKIIIHIGTYYKKQRLIKGHTLKKFGRGRSMIFHPTTSSQCLIHSLKAHNYLKKRSEKYDASLEFWLNEKVLPYDECDLLYEYKADGYEMDDITYLERENDMCIYVYCMSEKKKNEQSRLVIARHGNPIYREVVYLLLVDNGSHMCLIVDFNKFMKRATGSTHTYFCSKCLWSCDGNKEKITHHHDAECYNMKTTLRFPVKGVDNCILKFDKNGRTYPDRCFAVFDTESYLEKPRNNPNIISTHKCIAYCYIIVDRVLGPVFERYYVGENAADLFLQNLERDWLYIRKRIIKYPLDKNERAIQMLANAVSCLMCNSEFNDTVTPVMHHDHAIPDDNVISILCSECNLKLHDQKKVLTVIGHNSNRYDLNVLLRECKLDLHFKIHNKSGTEFHYLKNRCLKFIDAFAHLPASLDQLATLHIGAEKPIPCVRFVLEQIHPDAHDLLLTGKQSFFYEYLDTPSKLDDTKLPLREESYSSLTNKILPTEAYDKIVAIWEKAGCVNLRDLLIIYLKLDTALLGDIIATYRSDFYFHLGLDPIAHSSSPSLAWNSMLKYSKIELELITKDISWFSVLISDNIRGGLAQCFKTIVKANNESVPNFDPSQPKSFIYQFDMNALYSLCETYPLPTGNFKIEPATCFGENAEKLDEIELVNTPTGFFLQVDISVTPEVARYTDHFPLIINNMKITKEMLSRYQIRLIDRLGVKFVPSRRLLASHIPAKKILMSGILLQKLMKYGLKVTKVHLIISFDQHPFMRDFVQMNIEARINTSDPVLKNILKLINNAIFGRSIFNVVNHSLELHLIENPKQFMKRIMSPFFKHASTLNEYRMIASTYKQQILQISPLYLGFSILEISKSIMYNFYYGVLKPFYGTKVMNAYTDTDSYVIKLFTNSFEDDVLVNPHLHKFFDFSNFPSTHRLYSEEGKGALGRVKSETGEKQIQEVVCVRTKSYSILMVDGSIKATLKGISKSQHSEIKHEMYRNAVLDCKTQSFEFGSIKVNEKSVDTIKIRRLGISPLDVKRYMINGLDSVSHGHPDIKNSSLEGVSNPKKRSHSLAFKPSKKLNPENIELHMEVPKLFKSRLQTVPNIFVDDGL